MKSFKSQLKVVIQKSNNERDKNRSHPDYIIINVSSDAAYIMISRIAV